MPGAIYKGLLQDATGAKQELPVMQRVRRLPSAPFSMPLCRHLIGWNYRKLFVRSTQYADFLFVILSEARNAAGSEHRHYTTFRNFRCQLEAQPPEAFKILSTRLRPFHMRLRLLWVTRSVRWVQHPQRPPEAIILE
jgi:hypothetical protein